MESQATAGIGVGRTETVPGSSVNGGGCDQEVGNIFNCEEGEYDIARLAGGGAFHRVGVGTVTRQVWLALAWGAEGDQAPLEGESCNRGCHVTGTQPGHDIICEMVKNWGGC